MSSVYLARKKWGNPLWTFFHFISENISTAYYSKNHSFMNRYLYELISNIPCPVCKKHAQTYTKRNNFMIIRNKNQLIEYFYNFHNFVNKQTGKKIFLKEQLKIYSTMNASQVFQNLYNNFFKTYYGVRIFRSHITRGQKKKLIQLWHIYIRNKQHK